MRVDFGYAFATPHRLTVALPDSSDKTEKTLHLARGAARQWLGSGQPLGVQGMATHFGRLSFEMRFDPQTGKVSGSIELAGGTAPAVVLHVRLPAGLKVIAVTTTGADGTLSPDGTTVTWQHRSGAVRFEKTTDRAGSVTA